MLNRTKCLSVCLYLMLSSTVTIAGGGVLPDNDTVMKALVEELERSMADLSLDDLPKPYFLQYNAQDRLIFTMQAAYGGLLRSDENHLRYATSRIRVGSMELDNTNVGRGFGGRTGLPLDDDFVPLRHALWGMTDQDYKAAVETLARKIAYLKQKQVEDRPNDFSAAEPVRAIEPSAEIAFDRKRWEQNIIRLSARLKSYPQIQDAQVDFFAGAVNNWIANSEGTRLRTGDHGTQLEISVEIQADDGMLLGDSRQYVGLNIDDIPPVDKMLTHIDQMCENLIALSKAPILEHYTGPILFDAKAAGAAFDALLSDGLAARPIPLGGGGWNDDSFEKKIGRRILPRSFHAYDDPTEPRFNGKVLAGAYTYDDEGVAPKRITLVDKGVLKTLVAGRPPTKKIKQTTGHARSTGFGDPRASIGCLYISDEMGVSAEQLKEELIEAARDEGLEFGLRIKALGPGIPGILGDPAYAYKVYVEDGREELIRGMEFRPVEPRALKHIIAAGNQQKVYNATGQGVGRSIIAPAVLFEELELTRIEEEFDKPPILKSPLQRGKKGGTSFPE